MNSNFTTEQSTENFILQLLGARDNTANKKHDRKIPISVTA